jgi:hypothetical protein
MGFDGTMLPRRFDADARMRVVRECLEGVLEPRVATGTILDAMGELPRWSDLCDDTRLVEFVRGPLRLAVSARVGALAAAEVTDRICATLAMVQGRDAPPTREIPFSEGPVRVLLVAGSARLGVMLRGQLGGAAIALGHASDVDAARTMLERLEPELVVVDGVDPLDATVADLLLLLTEVPAGIPLVLWGCEQPWGSRVLSTKGSNRASLVPFDRRSGLEPLVDMVRSRRAA